ncbi:hypothetical protein EKQ61_01465 [Staphylococcus gallinarum]|uniref:YopX protein domain-containing protein n=2 Tax=Staphylococcus gallinarum TaxID=1293 RepID=A0ABQ0XZ02_STAGA|nr:YopX family protein [Staphylococcus gallinarum]KIR10658.1 hypothetical protein SH09_10845 [Staphylococcus gallinarum]RTX82862.1 hypothetical protein EKQ61_01465 [Staphylococcus gallinarum]GEQ04546.1 hypothetical protein SGA02_03740 [Staphylococcus gallinarum]
MIPKFREWDAEREDIMPGKGMSYGIREDYDDSFSIRFDHMEDLDIINKNGSIDRTVMMSTGLKDKHGKEIYDKDIVQDSYGDVYLIKWLDGGFVLTEFYNGGYDHYIINDSKSLEIIGDIYQYPHLLRSDGEWNY